LLQQIASQLILALSCGALPACRQAGEVSALLSLDELGILAKRASKSADRQSPSLRNKAHPLGWAFEIRIRTEKGSGKTATAVFAFK